MELRRNRPAKENHNEMQKGVTCQNFEGLIAPFLHHQLDEEKTRAFYEHAESCEHCYEDLRLAYTIEKAISQLDTEADDDFSNVDRELEQMMKKTRSSCQHRQRRKLIVQLLLFALEVMAVLVIAWYILH
ncbi:MAG: hypothetical protein SPL15_01055 [Lachnospiraceae bacterium]|nr:hypothetical protein [Lachnospiraceae bacterium]MDY5741577.1 hypothetical protein [Lachnospiraceae bacterium]